MSNPDSNHEARVSVASPQRIPEMNIRKIRAFLILDDFRAEGAFAFLSRMLEQIFWFRRLYIYINVGSKVGRTSAIYSEANERAPHLTFLFYCWDVFFCAHSIVI